MDPYQRPTDRPDDSKAWFTDSLTPSTPPTPEPAGSSPLRKVLIIGAVVAIIIVGALSAAKFFSVEACLSPEDYRSFAGQGPDAQLSPQAFYTASFDFPVESDGFSDASAGVSDQTLRKIAELDVRKRASSLTITLSADYYKNDSYQAAIARLDMLKQKLVSYGTAESDIVVKEPEEIDADGAVGEEYEVPEGAVAYASIASSSVCR